MMCLDEGCTLGPLYLYLEFGFAINLLFSIWNRLYQDWQITLDRLRSEHAGLKADLLSQEEIALKQLKDALENGERRTRRWWIAGRCSGPVCAITIVVIVSHWPPGTVVASMWWQAVLYVIGFVTLGLMVTMLLSTIFANKSAADKIAELRKSAASLRAARESATDRQMDLLEEWLRAMRNAN